MSDYAFYGGHLGCADVEIILRSEGTLLRSDEFRQFGWFAAKRFNFLPTPDRLIIVWFGTGSVLHAFQLSSDQVTMPCDEMEIVVTVMDQRNDTSLRLICVSGSM